MSDRLGYDTEIEIEQDGAWRDITEDVGAVSLKPRWPKDRPIGLKPAKRIKLFGSFDPWRPRVGGPYYWAGIQVGTITAVHHLSDRIDVDVKVTATADEIRRALARQRRAARGEKYWRRYVRRARHVRHRRARR